MMGAVTGPADQLLVIEGRNHVSSQLREILSDGGADERFSAVTVDALDEAFTRIRASRPACIVLDLAGRGDRGIEELIELRAAAPDVPVVAVTGERGEAVAAEAGRRGAQVCIVGEVDRALLAELIDQAIQRLSEERRLEQRAFHDPATGLASRAVFLDRLRGALARAVRGLGRPSAAGPRGPASAPQEPLQLAVILLEADLGPGAEKGLRIVASRLQSVLRPTDTVARLDGGEFAVICESAAGPLDVQGITRRLQRAVTEPTAPSDRGAAPDVNVGIAFDNGGTDPERMLRNAELALHHAHRAGGSTVVVFRDSMRGVVRARGITEPVLRRALEHRELHLAYQLMVDVPTGAVSGMEVVIRWATPDRGVLWPAEFLPAAEDTGVIVPIGAWVLRTAIRQVAQWQAALGRVPPLRLAVNLSTRELTDRDLGRMVIEQIAAAQHREGAPGLALEVSAASLAQVGPSARRTLDALRLRGVHLTLERAGAECASVDQLRELPVDTVKIDPLLVAELPGSRRATMIVERLVAASSELGMSVAAAGVETVEQLAAVRSLGCRTVQGHLLGRAMLAKRMTRVLVETPRR
jgi:EAL domain-containing protein (putative c-di-GMP-specific phosphodiesterase class I)/GGDEF domain-containing protein